MIEAKRILLLSGLKLYPPQSGGHLRSSCVAQALARSGFEVKIFSLAARQADYGWSRAPLIETIEEGLVEETERGWIWGLIQAIGRRGGWPRVWQHFLLHRGLMPKRLRRAIEEADIVICDLPYCPPPAGFKDKIFFLLSHNLEHRLLAQGTPREKAWADWMKDIEKKAPQRYQAILACAAEDQGFFRAYAGEAAADRVVLVPNGIDPRVYARAGADREALRGSLGLSAEDYLIVFSGSRFEPNLEALAFLQKFAKEQSPFLVAHRIHFLILGSMRDKPGREGALIYTGRVEATPPYFAAADAAINPVLLGSGSNVKIFEYLAAQLPVLSSGFGVRGTELKPDRDFLLFERSDLREQLEQFVQLRSKLEWKAFASEVWQRHKGRSDMQDIVAQALRELKLELRR